MEKKYLIICGKLYDGIKNEFQNNKKILIQGNRIKEVSDEIDIDLDTEVIDLSAATVTPGLIDAHVHLSLMETQNKRHEDIFNSPNYKTLAILRSAQKALARGFTSVRHVGCSTFDGFGAIDVKRSIDSGFFYGPRLKVIPMYLAVNGGPGDHSQSLKTNYMMAHSMKGHHPFVGSGVDFFVNAVRELQKLGSDFIKMMVSGSFFSPDSNPDMIYFRDCELEAIIETAHNLNMKVTAHTYGPEAICKLSNMGIDGIEHGALMNQKAADTMEKNGTYLVPTFYPYDSVISPDPLNPNISSMSQKLDRYAERLKEGRKHIVNSNIKLGYGTDIVFTHNNYDCGIEYYCWHRYGIDPFRILKAATVTNAEILGIQDIGTIEEGKLADISAWKRDLLTDSKALLDCYFVMKDGIIYNTESSIFDGNN